LLRAILAILKTNKLDIGEDWGEHEYATPTEDRPDEEAVFYELLVDDGESLTHFYQQLGLNQPCVQSDLRRLSKEKPGSREGGPLEFKAAYPVIFAALEAAFGLMPSNSRIAEQAHGMLRDGLRAGVSLLSTDMKQTYIMNDEYHGRRERKDCVLKREASIKHDEFKPKWHAFHSMYSRKLASSRLERGAFSTRTRK
jgi:hypothetical protein